MHNPPKVLGKLSRNPGVSVYQSQSLESMPFRPEIQSQGASHRAKLDNNYLTKSYVALMPRLNTNASLPNLTTDAGSGRVAQTSRY